MSHPLVLELNLRCWLRELSDRLGRPATLSSIPDDEIRPWQELGFTHLWLMGVWTTGPRSRTAALQATGLRESLDQALPGWQPSDIAGSPFAVADYKVPRSLGGEKGLQLFREQLRSRGIKLILDFIPNHTGLDHAWLADHPEYYVQSPTPAAGTFEHITPTGTTWIAHGKDPNFPPWTDTAQLDFRRVETQRAVAEAFQSVARRCDGIRCDMAMLVLRDIFDAHWGEFAGPEHRAEGEFWANLIRRVKRSQPDLLLLAEAYWDLEDRLQSLGFDYTYDKRCYDYLLDADPAATRRHVTGAGPRFLAACAHFIENHDEARAAVRFTHSQHCAAALLTLGLPGLRLIHDGQLTGSRTRLPVQLARRLPEPPNEELHDFYNHLLRALQKTAVGSGHDTLLPNREAWPGNSSDRCITVVQWQTSNDAFDLVVVNTAPHPSQCYVSLAVKNLERCNWNLQDLLSPENHVRCGDDLASQGLYLDVPAHAAQIFHFTPVA